MIENRKGVESMGGEGLGMGGNGRGKFGVEGMGLWAKKAWKVRGCGRGLSSLKSGVCGRGKCSRGCGRGKCVERSRGCEQKKGWVR